MLTRLVIDKVTYYVKVNPLFAAEGKLIDGILWIGQFSANAKTNSKFMLILPYDGSELLYYRLYYEIDYYSFVKVSMASIMRAHRRSVLELMSMVLMKRISSPFNDLNFKLTGATRKILWLGRMSVSSILYQERSALIKLNKAIEVCKFALKVKHQFSRTNDPLKLFRVYQLIASFAYYLKISPEMLLFNLKLSFSQKTFNKSCVNIIEINRLYFQTLVTKSFQRLGATKIQLLRHSWLLTIRRLNNLHNLISNQLEVFIPNLNFWTIFYRTLLLSSTLPWVELNSEGVLEWRNNLMLILNYINYALSFYKFSAGGSPIIPFALVILNKIKSLNFFIHLSKPKVKASPISYRSIVMLPSPTKNLKMQLKPLFNRVIIIPDNTNKTSTGGIILPETMTDNISIGVIGEVSDEQIVKIGDKVLYNRSAALRYSFNGCIIDILDVVELLALVRND